MTLGNESNLCSTQPRSTYCLKASQSVLLFQMEKHTPRPRSACASSQTRNLMCALYRSGAMFTSSTIYSANILSLTTALKNKNTNKTTKTTITDGYRMAQHEATLHLLNKSCSSAQKASSFHLGSLGGRALAYLVPLACHLHFYLLVLTMSILWGIPVLNATSSFAMSNTSAEMESKRKSPHELEDETRK